MAQVTNTDIRARIKNMLANDSAITAVVDSGSVFDRSIEGMPRALLPVIMVTDGSATYNNNSMGNRYVNPTQNFTITVLFSEVSSDADLNISSDITDAITIAIENLFVLYDPLIYNGSALKGVRGAQLTSSTAITPRAYPTGSSRAFVQKQWTLQVTYTRAL